MLLPAGLLTPNNRFWPAYLLIWVSHEGLHFLLDLKAGKFFLWCLLTTLLLPTLLEQLCVKISFEKKGGEFLT